MLCSLDAFWNNNATTIAINYTKMTTHTLEEDERLMKFTAQLRASGSQSPSHVSIDQNQMTPLIRRHQQ